MSDLFNRGDTAYLLLNYTLNGEPLEEGIYQEIELQINEQGGLSAIKKLYSQGDIFWSDQFTYNDKGTVKTFEGYVCGLTQEETFRLSHGVSEVQLRIMINEEVGSSAYSEVDVGKALSEKVLE